MQKAVLLYNPLSGRRHDRRVHDVNAVSSVLQAAGVEVLAAATESSAGAAEQARKAIAAGCDTVFACGGDGTIHDVLQGMVGTDAALGIIPLGTANALAHDLMVPLDAVKAAQSALHAQVRRFAVGRVEFQNFARKKSSCYFTVAAGIGVDAHLFHKLNPEFKKRHGMVAYYAKAWHLWATHAMPFFNVEWNDEAGQTRKEAVTELLAVRIGNFGGLLRNLAPGASLDRQDLRLVLCKTKSRMAYLHYVFQGLYRSQRNVTNIELVHAPKLYCSQLMERGKDGSEPQAIYLEADGELLGTLPAAFSMVPNAINLLIPAR
jgi:diacylglycerol kinase (ATP)